jgi:hypothetical protein
MLVWLRFGVVSSVVLEDVGVEEAFAEVVVGVLVRDSTLLGAAIRSGIVLALHGERERERGVGKLEKLKISLWREIGDRSVHGCTTTSTTCT